MTASSECPVCFRNNGSHDNDCGATVIGEAASVSRASADYIRKRLEAAARLAEAAELKRNAIIYNRAGFLGEWVAVPHEDFYALCAAVAAYREAGK